MVKLVFSLFPFVLAGTLGVVFVLLGVFFCSVLVPLRSVLTVTMTLAWVYGFQVPKTSVSFHETFNCIQ